MNIIWGIVFPEYFYSEIIITYYILLVPGEASQENLLVRQVLRTSPAWQYHTPGITEN